MFKQIKRGRAVGFGVVIAGLLAVSSVGVGAQGDVNTQDKVSLKGVVSSANAQVSVAAERPWTAEEMRNAVPHPADLADPAAVADAATQEAVAEAADTNATPGFSTSGRPDARPTSAESTAPSTDELAAVDAATPNSFPGGSAYSYPPPFTRLSVFTGINTSSAYKVYPYSAVGKLFFRQNGVNYVCSASVVSVRSIYTAGHCVHAGNNKSTGWSTNVVFVPAYRDGVAPYGQWTTAFLVTSTQWYTYGNPNGFRRDYGSARINLLNGSNIGNKTGWLGFAWNQSTKQHFNDFGYPAASPFNGQRMITCQASTNKADTGIGGSGPNPLAIGCDMTGGSSGGPWIIKFAGFAGSVNYVNGVNSYKYNNDSLQMYSPYLDTTAYNVFDATN
jgi:V8-like Glu-specific endopeptidase